MPSFTFTVIEHVQRTKKGTAVITKRAVVEHLNLDSDDAETWEDHVADYIHDKWEDHVAEYIHDKWKALEAEADIESTDEDVVGVDVYDVEKV